MRFTHNHESNPGTFQVNVTVSDPPICMLGPQGSKYLSNPFQTEPDSRDLGPDSHFHTY